MKELSDAIIISWEIAAQEAAQLRSEFIEPEHFLLGLFSLEKIPDNQQISPEFHIEKMAFVNLLIKLGINPTHVRHLIRIKIGMGVSEHHGVVHRSPECKKLFIRAKQISRSEVISCQDIFLAIIENPGDLITTVFEDSKIDILSLQSLFVSSDFSDGQVNIEEIAEQANVVRKYSSTPFLDQYGRDLTQEAKEGKLGNLIGRRQEILQLIQILARLKKNNPVLVGEAGVGKTAIVEGLAQRIVQGKDAMVLGGKRLIELNIGALISGSQYRGEFEERLTKIISEVKANPEIILFVDEIHTIVGAGQIGSGGLDAGNILKPALARGDFRCIGATTISEYREYIESDPALERRFEMIMVYEPSREETLEILRGVRSKFEEHHNVHFTDKALEAAVDLSVRFDSGHQLPDKAVSLLDTAGSSAVVPRLSMVMPLSEIEEKDKTELAEVDETSIAKVISRQTGIDEGIISPYIGKSYLSRILELGPYLKERIIGQDGAIDRVSKRLLVAQAGLSNDTGALATFLFTGPSGVGKTQLAIYLAEFLFGNQESLIRLDMSEYKEEHSVSKLIGSPPGYVGYEDEGQLTSKLRTHPYSVVLLDECEKAHPNVYDLFLQVLDAGRLTDSKGRNIDTRNAIFILTSNISSFNAGSINKTEQVIENETLAKLGEYFRVEFLNRIDELIVFRFLTEESIRKILLRNLEELSQKFWKKQGVEIIFSDNAVDCLLYAGYTPQLGARELFRTMEKNIQEPLLIALANGTIQRGHKVTIDEKGGGLIFIQR